MKHTPLTQIHQDLEAKMTGFAGYLMPVSYTSIKNEHLAVRNSVGMFDVSHMGEFMLSGKNAAALVQRLSSNDVDKIVPGQAQYCCMPNENGGIVDDMIVYKITEDEFMLVVNASNMEKDWNWIKQNNDIDVVMNNVSDETALLAVQGPNAVKCLQKLSEEDLSAIGFYHFAIGEFAGIKDVLISATGYTGSGGFELYIPSDKAPQVWQQIMEAGREFNIQPIGLGARDTLRLEMGYCLYGNDIDDTTNPIEAGLGWITKVDTGFIAADIVKKVKEEGAKRRLVGFTMIDRGIPRKGYEIVDANGNHLGEVTSGTQSPSLETFIGMGYVNKPFDKSGTEIFVKIRDKAIKAEVEKLPFYKK